MSVEKYEKDEQIKKVRPMNTRVYLKTGNMTNGEGFSA